MQSILILLLVTLLLLATAAWRLAMPATPPARERTAGPALAVASEPTRTGRRIDVIFEYEPPSASRRPGASARPIAPTSESSPTPGGPPSASAPEHADRARSLRRLLSLYERIGPGD
jgi:hypothetical protein